MIARLAVIVALAVAVPAAGAPRFVPSPKQAFQEFVALNAPRPEVPVGALWIDGYGPSGQGAAPDNLETVRSLNGMVIDTNLQLTLTAGLFDLVGIEPRYRRHYSARFSDLSIVRVKDLTRLAGPPGEPRIVEAIKAGTISVTADSEVGLNARTGFNFTPDGGSTANSRTNNHSIEGRDLYVAIRVATFKVARSPKDKVRLRQNGAESTGRIDDFEIHLRHEPCQPSGPDADCKGSLAVAVVKLSSWPATAPPQYVPLSSGLKAILSLPVPISDRNGGLFDSLELQWLPSCKEALAKGCGRKGRLFAQYQGRRLDDLKSPEMVRW